MIQVTKNKKGGLDIKNTKILKNGTWENVSVTDLDKLWRRINTLVRDNKKDIKS